MFVREFLLPLGEGQDEGRDVQKRKGRRIIIRRLLYFGRLKKA